MTPQTRDEREHLRGGGQSRVNLKSIPSVQGGRHSSPYVDYCFPCAPLQSREWMRQKDASECSSEENLRLLYYRKGTGVDPDKSKSRKGIGG